MLVDGRWSGSTGIGRFTREVTARLRGIRLLRGGVRPLHPIEPCWLGAVLLARRPRAYFSPGFNPPLWSPVPFAFTLHDLIHLRFAGECTPRRRAYYELVVRRAARAADRVFTVSEHSREDILAWTGLAPERVVVVGGGVSSEFAARGARFDPGAPYLVCVSNSFPHKNLDRLLAAFAASAASRELRLVLVTRPTEALARRCVALGIRERVSMITGVGDAELASIYRGAVASVCPSLYEGFGLPVVESMACGTPVVCADRTSLPEIAGAAALYVDPERVDSLAAGIDRVVADSALRTRLRAAGRARARRFTWDRVAGRIGAVLDEIAAARPRRSRWPRPAAAG